MSILTEKLYTYSNANCNVHNLKSWKSKYNKNVIYGAHLKLN